MVAENRLEFGAPSHLLAMYPECQAGGFSRVDGTVSFYVRVHALLRPQSVVLDFGAGRGAYLEDPVQYRRDLRVLRGRAARVIAVDIDDAVLANEAADERHVVKVGEKLPLSDQAVDLIVSDSTFEHVADPGWVSAELDRVLRPGGWICARTPNRWGYIGVGARIVPNALHVGALRWLQPGKEAKDTFPTAYNLNTPRQLAQWFPASRYHHVVWASESEPTYVGESAIAARGMRVLAAVTPPNLRSVLYVFLQKHLTQPS